VTVNSPVKDPLLANNSASVTSLFLIAGQLVVLPQNLGFGTLRLGSNAQGSFVARNVGSVEITNVAVIVSTGPFRILSPTSFGLPGHSSTNVLVSFSPASTGSFSNLFSFLASNGPNRTNSATGTGAQVPSAAFTGSPTNGPWSLVVTFTDTSTGTITNRFWDFGDGTTSNAAGTTLTHTYVAPGTNAVMLTATGPVGTNTLLRPGFIRVTNPPPRLAISPASLIFGQVVIGQTNVRTFQLTNSGGGIITGTATATFPFGIQNGVPYTLTNGETRLVTVSFSPTNSGTISSNVTFVSSGGNSTNRVIGSALTPAQLTVLPPTLNFGAVALNSNARANFVVTNKGGVSLSNVTASVGAGPFVVVMVTRFNLSGFGSTNLVISFTPGSAATFSNAVVINTGNDGNSTNPVTGIGAVAPAAAFTATPTGGFKPLPVTFTDTSTGTITNHFWTFGDGSTTNTTATSFSHTYSNAGLYGVTLTVSGPLGVNTRSRANYISVGAGFLITAIRMSGSNVIVSFLSSTGAFYSLDYNDTLTPSGWNTAVGSIPGIGGVVTATNAGGTGRTSRFYRVRQLP